MTFFLWPENKLYNKVHHLIFTIMRYPIDNLDLQQAISWKHSKIRRTEKFELITKPPGGVSKLIPGRVATTWSPLNHTLVALVLRRVAIGAAPDSLTYLIYALWWTSLDWNLYLARSDDVESTSNTVSDWDIRLCSKCDCNDMSLEY